MKNKLTISVSEVAERLGISKPTAYTLARRADFPAIRIGTRIVVHEAKFEAWVEAQADKGRNLYEN